MFRFWYRLNHKYFNKLKHETSTHEELNRKLHDFKVAVLYKIYECRNPADKLSLKNKLNVSLANQKQTISEIIDSFYPADNEI